jgi:pyruvate carboxylase subunit B
MYSLTINNNNYDVIIKEVSDEDVRVEVNGVEHLVAIRDIKHIAQTESQVARAAGTKPRTPIQPVTPVAPAPSSAGICSPIPGHILEIYVEVGDQVSCGQKLLILEAMKLENIISSDRDGKVKKILVKEGDSVNHDQALIIVE